MTTAPAAPQTKHSSTDPHAAPEHPERWHPLPVAGLLTAGHGMSEDAVRDLLTRATAS